MNETLSLSAVLSRYCHASCTHAMETKPMAKMKWQLLYSVELLFFVNQILQVQFCFRTSCSVSKTSKRTGHLSFMLRDLLLLCVRKRENCCGGQNASHCFWDTQKNLLLRIKLYYLVSCPNPQHHPTSVVCIMYHVGSRPRRKKASMQSQSVKDVQRCSKTSLNLWTAPGVPPSIWVIFWHWSLWGANACNS